MVALKKGPTGKVLKGPTGKPTSDPNCCCNCCSCASLTDAYNQGHDLEATFTVGGFTRTITLTLLPTAEFCFLWFGTLEIDIGESCFNAAQVIDIAVWCDDEDGLAYIGMQESFSFPHIGCTIDDQNLKRLDEEDCDGGVFTGSASWPLLDAPGLECDCGVGPITIDLEEVIP